MQKSDFSLIESTEYRMQQEKKQRESWRKERKKKLYKELYLDYKYGFRYHVDIKKAVYYGIMAYGRKDVPPCRSENELRECLLAYTEMYDIVEMMTHLCISDIMQMFPIGKDYCGKRYECKDYFTTMKYLNCRNLNHKMSWENVEDLLWEYYNSNIMIFGVKRMLFTDRIRKLHGEDGIFESFIKDAGLDDKIHTYSYDKAAGTMTDQKTGEVFMVEDPQPAEIDHGFAYATGEDGLKTAFEILK